LEKFKALKSIKPIKEEETVDHMEFDPEIVGETM